MNKKRAIKQIDLFFKSIHLMAHISIVLPIKLLSSDVNFSLYIFFY